MSSQSLARQWALIRHIPTAPRRISTTEISKRVASAPLAATARTVQRDLILLSAHFPLLSETEGRSNYWWFPREARLLEIPGMQSSAALAFLMARESVAPLMPPAVMRQLSPWFANAENVLAESVPSGLKRWRQCVRVVSRGPVLSAPRISAPVHAAISTALLEGKQLLAIYRRRSAQNEKRFMLNPLGLVLKEGVLYLVATTSNYSDPRHYALQRFAHAEVGELPCKAPSGFKLDDYIEQSFHYPAAPSLIKLVLRMDSGVAVHLEERPLAKDQASKTEGARTVLTATVPDNLELRWWLLSLGAGVEVLQPTKLRQEIKHQIAAMAAHYD